MQNNDSDTLCVVRYSQTKEDECLSSSMLKLSTKQFTFVLLPIDASSRCTEASSTTSYMTNTLRSITTCTGRRQLALVACQLKLKLHENAEILEILNKIYKFYKFYKTARKRLHFLRPCHGTGTGTFRTVLIQ